MTIAIIIFALGLAAPHIINISTQLALSMTTAAIAAAISTFTIIYALENKEKSYREKRLDDITDAIWKYIDSCSRLTARCVMFYPFKKESLEIHGNFHAKRENYDHNIEALKNTWVTGQLAEDRLKQLIEFRNSFVVNEGPRGELAREKVNNQFSEIKQDAAGTFNAGYRAADLIGIFGGIWGNNKSTASNFSTETKELRTELEKMVNRTTSIEYFEPDQKLIQNIESQLQRLRGYNVLLTQRELLGENSKHGDTHRFKKKAYATVKITSIFLFGASINLISI